MEFVTISLFDRQAVLADFTFSQTHQHHEKVQEPSQLRRTPSASDWIDVFAKAPPTLQHCQVQRYRMHLSRQHPDKLAERFLQFFGLICVCEHAGHAVERLFACMSPVNRKAVYVLHSLHT